jgi:hypothetical protein
MQQGVRHSYVGEMTRSGTSGVENPLLVFWFMEWKIDSLHFITLLDEPGQDTRCI